jgi:hypothetical protein
MTERWAMISDGVVVNVCRWDGDLNTWQPPEGIVMQPAPDNVGIGWTWDGENWSPPVIEE